MEVDVATNSAQCQILTLIITAVTIVIHIDIRDAGVGISIVHWCLIVIWNHTNNWNTHGRIHKHGITEQQSTISDLIQTTENLQLRVEHLFLILSSSNSPRCSLP